jgi:hypothetical protein
MAAAFKSYAFGRTAKVRKAPASSLQLEGTSLERAG